MNLPDLLLEHKSKLLQRWIDHVLGSYHADSTQFIQKETDRFANPLGYNITNALTALYKTFCGQREDFPETELAEFIKVRAVQEFSPSEAVSFIYAIKDIVFTGCGDELSNVPRQEWLDFEKRIDTAALKVFDLYSAFRERLYQVKLKELKSGNFILTEHAVCPSALERRKKKAAENDKQS